MVNGKVQNKDPKVRCWGYKLGKIVRKHLIFSMAFTPTSTSLPSSFSAALTANDMFMGFELEVNSINQAIEEAKEQLHQALEMKQEEAMQQWMKKSWRNGCQRGFGICIGR